MDAPQGTVISISDDAESALVEVNAAAACARCAAGKGCGAGIVASGGKTRRVVAAVPAGADIAAGDVVRLLLEPRNVLVAASTVYGLPLLGASCGAVLAFAASLGDVSAVAITLAGMASGAILAHLRLGRNGCLRRFTPQILV